MGNRSGFTPPKSEGFSGGFTIIEVILFLAISGLLLAVAIAGITTNINNSRFNDAIRSTTSYLQTQYSEVAVGQSDRAADKSCVISGSNITITNTTSTLGTSNCVIMGRFIKLEGSSFTVRYIVGYGSNLLGGSADNTTAINNMKPIVAGNNTYQSSYDIPWGIELVNTKLYNGVSNKTGFAIIRSPASGSILYYVAKDVTTAEPALDNSIINDSNLNKDAELCFEDNSSSRVGRIKIGSGQGQEVVQTDLANTGACPS